MDKFYYNIFLANYYIGGGQVMLLFKRSSVLAVLALALVLVFSLGACSGQNSNVLKIGVDDTYPPMEFKDEKNVTVGFDVDLAKEIGKKLGKEVQFVSNDWAGIFQALESNKFDMILSSVSITEARQKEHSLTKAYIANAQVIVTKPGDTTIKEPKDLKGKKVGVQIGTTADESAEKYIKETSFDLKKYDQVIQPFSDMKAGRLDAIIVDEVVARYYVTQDKASFQVSGARLTNEPIGICFAKKNGEMRDKVQKILDDLKADGTLKKISEKWFNEDLTNLK